MGEVLAAIVAGTGGGLKAYGNKRAADAQIGNLKFQRILALQNAEFERKSGSRQEAQSRKFAQQVLATNETRVAKSGVRGDEGSPLQLAAEVASQLERGILEERLSSQVQRQNFLNEAYLLGKAAKHAKKNQGLQLASDILGAGTSAGGAYFGAK